MVASRVPAVIDALVTILTAADLGAPIWDGPITTGDPSDAVYIGYDADPQGGEEQGAEVQQGWAGIGTESRDEEGQIMCAVVVLTGNQITGWKGPRDRAYALLDGVNGAIRGTPAKASLGLSPPMTAELWPGAYFQEANPDGFQARLLFQIHYTTRV
jgi:hypothetical protein